MTIENRRAPRKSVHLAAKLTRADSSAVVAGHLINMSATGALLKSSILTDKSAMHPESVWECTLPSDAFTVTCKVVHQNDSNIGLKFTSTPKVKR